MQKKRRHFAELCYSLLALALFLDSSIGCTYITHPLSDENTSVPDLHLLGKWKVKKTENNDVKIGMLVIDRKPDAPNVLMATLINGEGKQSSIYCSRKSVTIVSLATRSGAIQLTQITE